VTVRPVVTAPEHVIVVDPFVTVGAPCEAVNVTIVDGVVQV
jgi:hypothetical protein